jgi:hypothetical protein
MREMTTTKTRTQEKPQRPAAKATGDRRSAIKKTTDLSEQVLEQLQTGQRNAIAAVRKFADSADETRPTVGDGHSRPQELIDSALELSEQLVQVQYGFVRQVVHSAGEALGGSSGKE